MSGTFSGCKFVLILTVLLVTICLTLMAMCMEVGALVNPRWQVVNISDLKIVHEHGLWIDCIQKTKEGLPEVDEKCSYKFENANGNGELQHRFLDWHKAVICMLSAALLCAFMAFQFLICAAFLRIAAVVANVLLLISAVFSTVGISVFFVYSHRVEYRFITGVTGTYEQIRGYPFWLAVCATLLYLCAFVSSIFLSTLVFFYHNRQYRSVQTFPKQNTAV